MIKLMEAGALDAFVTPIQMKKNRPGTMLSVIAPPDMRRTLTEIIFRLEDHADLGVHWAVMRDPEGNVVFHNSTPFLPQDNNMTSLGVLKVPEAQPDQLGDELRRHHRAVLDPVAGSS